MKQFISYIPCICKGRDYNQSLIQDHSELTLSRAASKATGRAETRFHFKLPFLEALWFGLSIAAIIPVYAAN